MYASGRLIGFLSCSSAKCCATLEATYASGRLSGLLSRTQCCATLEATYASGRLSGLLSLLEKLLFISSRF